MRLRENIGVVLAIAVLGSSLSANVVLARKVREMSPAPLAGFDSRRPFPLLTGESLDGAPLTIDFTAPTVVYVFSPNCGWCKADQPNLAALKKHAGGAYRFVGVTLKNNSAPAKYTQAMQEYLTSHPFPGEIVVLDPDRLDPQTARDIRLTPQTIVIQPGGVVTHAWAGALIGRRQEEAQRFFGISLPGVSAQEK